MKLHDIKPLFENLQAPTMGSLQSFLDHFCSPYFKELQNPPDLKYVSPCFRGIAQDVGDFAIIHTKSDRKPRDSDQHTHQLFDNWFLQNFGVKMRSNKVMFATGSPDSALEYTVKKGDPSYKWANNRIYNVFPIGQFKYVWSPLTKDLFSVYESLLMEAVENTVGFGQFEEDPESCYPQIDAYILSKLDDMMYTDDNLADALRYENEIMFHCDSYLAVRQHVYEQFLDLVKDTN